MTSGIRSEERPSQQDGRIPHNKMDASRTRIPTCFDNDPSVPPPPPLEISIDQLKLCYCFLLLACVGNNQYTRKKAFRPRGRAETPSPCQIACKRRCFGSWQARDHAPRHTHTNIQARERKTRFCHLRATKKSQRHPSPPPRSGELFAKGALQTVTAVHNKVVETNRHTTEHANQDQGTPKHILTTST